MDHDTDDYAYTAKLLRKHMNADRASFQAVCSNNLNIILGALDQAARGSGWSFDKVDGMCLRAFAEGTAHGRKNPLPSMTDDLLGWEVSGVAGELAEICS